MTLFIIKHECKNCKHYEKKWDDDPCTKCDKLPNRLDQWEKKE